MATTYTVSGQAHGGWFVEPGFGSLQDAMDYASQIIDGDQDATIDITSDGVA